jgi:hypothetical protein
VRKPKKRSKVNKVRGRPRTKKLPPGLMQAVEAVGSQVELARRIGVVQSAIHKWATRIPADRVLDIERASGIPREKLRPDLYKR